VDMTYSLSRIAEVKNSFRVLVKSTENLQDLGDAKKLYKS
jgi:hypothetical protein